MEESSIDALSLKPRIPQFWRDSPKLWFAHFETTIAHSKISNENKLSLVVAQLEKTDFEQISDIIMAPANENRYTLAKERLISIYEESEGQKLHKILNDMDLGDQKPSQLLRRMRNLAHGMIPDSTLRLLWINHLPPATRAILSINKEDNLESLATMADKMNQQAREVNSVCTCKNQAGSSSSCADAYDHQRAIEELTQEVAALKAQRSNRYNYNTRQSPRYQNRQFIRSSSHSQICFYHQKFGKAARKCQSPCRMNKKSEN